MIPTSGVGNITKLMNESKYKLKYQSINVWSVD